jgi:hypothetical protein
MTDRREPTPAETVATALAQLDQATAELTHLYAHLTRVVEHPATAHQAARSAAIVAGVTGQVADQLRGLAHRQSAGSSVS